MFASGTGDLVTPETSKEHIITGQSYNPDISPNELVARQRVKPMPDKSELLKRHSFPGPDDNRYISLMIKGARK